MDIESIVSNNLDNRTNNNAIELWSLNFHIFRIIFHEYLTQNLIYSIYIKSIDFVSNINGNIVYNFEEIRNYSCDSNWF